MLANLLPTNVLTSNTPLRLIFVDGQHMFREGFQVRYGQHPECTLLGTGGCMADLASLVVTHHPEVAIVDICTPCRARKPLVPDDVYHLMAMLAYLRHRSPTTRFFLMLEHPVRSLLSLAVQAGISAAFYRSDVTPEGFIAFLRAIPADTVYLSPALRAALQTARAYPPVWPLSPRQIAILAAFAYYPERSLAEQAQALNISADSLPQRLQYIYERLEVSDLVGAVMLLVKRGLLGTDPRLIWDRDHLSPYL